MQRIENLSGEKTPNASRPSLSIGMDKMPAGSAPHPSSSSASNEGSPRSLAMKVLNVLLIVITAFILAYLIRIFIITPYEIPSGSMLDTIQIEDKVMSERISYYFSDPKPGDIVTFQDPQQPDRTLIKRVIATEGQTVDIKDGNVYIDGKKIDEPYLKEGTYTEPLYEHPEDADPIAYPYTVPEGSVWVMGDNRTESADSRYFGAIDTDTVSGHAIIRYWPLDRFGLIE